MSALLGFPRRSRAAAALAIVPVILLASSASAAGGDPNTQAQYLHGAGHSSFSAATAITTGNAGSWAVAWHWHPDAPAAGHPRNDLYSSPGVVGGVVYTGSNSGTSTRSTWRPET